MRRLERRLRLLAAFNALALCALVPLALGAFRPSHGRFADLDVERLRIVTPDGTPIIVMARPGLLPGPTIAGKAYPASVSEGREQLGGMIFFNQRGDEVGGLIFNGFAKGDSSYSALGHLSLDQWQQNQVVALQYLDNGRTRRAGLRVYDRPTTVTLNGELDRIVAAQGATPAVRDSLARLGAAARARGESGAERVFIGSQDRTAQVTLRDAKGRVRARLVVDSADVARLEFLDVDGKVVSRYP